MGIISGIETVAKIKLFVATKAFINFKGKILILRESIRYTDGTNVGKYVIPGGRITPGQRFDESLLREIKEETGLKIKLGRPFYVGEWRPKVRGEQWQIIGTFFECFSRSSKVRLSKDHDDYKWIDAKDFKSYNLVDNLTPVFRAYLKLQK